MRRVLPFAPALLLACAAACSAPPALQNGVFDAGRVRYRIGAPEGGGWQQIKVEEGQVAFVEPTVGATLSSHAECTNTRAPLRALTSHVVLGMTERKITSERVETLAGREALRTRMTAKLDGVPQELEIVVVKKDGCHFDFVYSAPPERFAAKLGDFRRFVGAFEKLRAAGGAR